MYIYPLPQALAVSQTPLLSFLLHLSAEKAQRKSLKILKHIIGYTFSLRLIHCLCCPPHLFLKSQCIFCLISPHCHSLFLSPFLLLSSLPHHPTPQFLPCSLLFIWLVSIPVPILQCTSNPAEQTFQLVWAQFPLPPLSKIRAGLWVKSLLKNPT